MAETTPLLGRDDLGDATASQPLDLVPIYSLVLWVHDIITDRVETSLKYEQIKTPQIYAYLIKPIVEECMVTVGPCEEENRAETHPDSCDHDETISVGIIYSLLANQVQFLRE